jgi:hypothetical protein
MTSVLVDFDEAFKSKTGIPLSTVNDTICLVASGAHVTLWVTIGSHENLIREWANQIFTEEQNSRVKVLNTRPRNLKMWVMCFFGLRPKLDNFDFYYMRLFPFSPAGTPFNALLRIDDPFGVEAKVVRSFFKDFLGGLKLKLAFARTIRTLSYRRLLNRGDVIHVFNSNFTSRLWQSIYGPVRYNYIIYPPVQFSLPSNSRNESEYTILASHELPYFIFIGGQRQRKDPSSVINAWAESPNFTRARIVVVGEIPDIYLSDRSRRLISAGLLVFRQNISILELENLVTKAAALVFNSAGEGFGNPIAEAVYLGVAIICNDLEPFKEIGIRNTWFYQSGNYAEAVTLMLYVLDKKIELKPPFPQNESPFGYDSAITSWKKLLAL